MLLFLRSLKIFISIFGNNNMTFYLFQGKWVKSFNAIYWCMWPILSEIIFTPFSEIRILKKKYACICPLIIKIKCAKYGLNLWGGVEMHKEYKHTLSFTHQFKIIVVHVYFHAVIILIR